MRWLYRFSANGRFPDPVDEIRRLASLAGEGRRTFLLLEDREHPPLSGEVRHDTRIYLATATRGESGRRLLIHGEGRIGESYRGPTPESVRPLYGEHASRWFREIIEPSVFDDGPRPASSVGISAGDEEAFLAGRASAKRLSEDSTESDGPIRPARTVEEFLALPFFGMWADRKDLGEGGEWARGLRQQWRRRARRSD